MIDFYIELLKNGDILLNDIAFYWRNKLLNELEEREILGQIEEDSTLKEILNSLSDISNEDIEAYLNAEDDTTTLDDGVTSNET